MPRISVARRRVNVVSDRSRVRSVGLELTREDIREIDNRVEERMSVVRSNHRSFSPSRNRERALRLRLK